MTVLYSPASYKTASPQQKAKICNGCGSASSKFDFVPDTFWGLDVSEVCDIHDWMYHEGYSIEDKDEADRVMLNNNIRLIEKAFKEGRFKRFQKWLKKRRLSLASFYYNMVQKYGGPAFWDNKN